MEKQEKRKQAVALEYDQEKQQAPKVVAKGAGYVAENILKQAEQHEVPVYRNQTLTNMLMAIELDREIPQELYQLVAEVLAFVYRLDQKYDR